MTSTLIEGTQNGPAADLANDELMQNISCAGQPDDDLTGDDDEHLDDCQVMTTVEAHSPLALFEANRWRARWAAWFYGSWLCSFTREDLRQVGEIALWKLCEEYRSDWEWKFSTYAYNAVKWAILGERKRLWRDKKRQRPFPRFDGGASAEDLIPLECQTPDERVADTEEIHMIHQRVTDRVAATGTTRHFALKCMLRDATRERDPIPMDHEKAAQMKRQREERAAAMMPVG